MKNKLIPWIVCFVAALFYCYEFLLRVAPTVMVEDFRREFFLNGSGIGVLLSCYSFAYTPMQLPGGPLMDYYGPRRLLLMSVILCCVGSLLIPSIVNVYVSGLSLFLIGIGSAFAFVGVLKLAVNWLPHRYFSLISGITTMLGMFGAIFGQRAMNDVVIHKGWQSAWILSGVIGLLLFFLAYLFIHDCPESKKQNKSIKNHINILEPLKEFFLLVKGSPQFLLNGIIGGLLFLPISVFGSAWGVEFLRYAFSYPYELASDSVPFVFAGLAVGGPLAGWASSYYKKTKILIQISSVSLLLLFLMLMFVQNISVKSVQHLLFLLGFFVGPQVLVFGRSVALSSKKLAGSAAASTNFLVMIPTMIYPMLIGVILDFCAKQRVEALNHFTRIDFQYAVSIIPLSLLVALIISFFITEQEVSDA